jgi:cytochrome aa3-600 menaquinol oxidase subunit 2
MQTQLILTADQVGEYMGANTNFNGKGYAKDNFTVEAKSSQDFAKWVADVKNKEPKLTKNKYAELLKPSNLGRETFSSTHLAFDDQSKMNSKNYLYPELYKNHDYPGQIFKDPQDKSMKMEMKGSAEAPMNSKDSKVSLTNGGAKQ